MAEENSALTKAWFTNHTILNEAATLKEGRPIYDEIELCNIAFGGNKQTIGGFPAHEVYGYENDPSTGERKQMTYAIKWNKEYLAFKSGDARSLGGTPLEELTFLTASKRLELKALHIHTAESLAALDGANLKTLGMGGRDMQLKAQAYLDTAAKVVDVVGFQSELAKRDAEIEALKASILQMQKADDKQPATVKEPEEEVEKSPFDQFGDEDIVNWIKDAQPDLDIDRRWSRKTLLAKADAINARLAKEKGLKTE